MSEEPKKTKPAARQRRPAFDREHGVAVAQALFHARGYDAVGVAELTGALGIVPPSLYAAYGSKLALFERALASYVTTDALPLEHVLASGKPPATLKGSRQGLSMPPQRASTALPISPSWLKHAYPMASKRCARSA